MTAEQARRAAKILRDLMQSLTITHYNLRHECHTLAQALEDFALEEHAEEIMDREAF